MWLRVNFCRYHLHLYIGLFLQQTTINQTGKKVGKSSGGSSRPKPKPSTARSAPVVSSSSTRPLRERPTGASGQSQTNVSNNNKAADSVVADATLMKKNADLTAKLTEMEQTVADIEKERDFYFAKLRDIEVMLQVHQEAGEEGNPVELVDKVFKVLYATAEEGITVSDDGEVSLFLFVQMFRVWKCLDFWIETLHVPAPLLPVGFVQIIDQAEQELENALFEE